MVISYGWLGRYGDLIGHVEPLSHFFVQKVASAKSLAIRAADHDCPREGLDAVAVADLVLSDGKLDFNWVIFHAANMPSSLVLSMSYFEIFLGDGRRLRHLVSAA